MELTLSIIKPDAVKRGLTGEINALIEKNKMRIVAQKMLHLSLVDAKGFYFVHKERAFFNERYSFVLILRELLINFKFEISFTLGTPKLSK